MITPLMTLMTTAVKKVSHAVVRDFNELEYLRSNSQSAEDFAQKTNTNCQSNLQKDLAKFKPRYGFIYSDGEKVDNSDECNYFYLSGIVGFENFKRAIPDFAISFCLKRDSAIVASLFYNPISHELYYAEQGVGAFCNQKRLKQTEKKLLSKEDYLLCVDTKALSLDEVKQYQSLRISNCIELDLCYAAAQKIDKVCLAGSYKSLNVSGALLLAKEAGCSLDVGLDDKNNINKLMVNF
jgi:myo-inositol-1(or 4)-monophosphatase